MVSIIVPVYKSEKTISRCIESILVQTYKDIEIVLVDDGSPDKSGEICKKYSEQDSRIKYHRKTNGGVASARNYGLQIAQGEYVLFVDSDDYIMPDMIEILFNSMIKNDTDMAICGFEVISLKNQKSITFGNGIYNGYAEICDMLIEKYTKRILNTCWGKLYKKELLSVLMNSYFPIGEDLIFNIENLKNFQKIVVVDKSLYIYDCRNESLTRSSYKLSYEIIDKQYIIIKNVFYKLFDSDKLIKIVCKDHLNSIIDCFRHSKYSIFSMRNKLYKLLNNYTLEIEMLEPKSKMEKHLKAGDYNKICFILYKKRIISKLKNFIKGKKVVKLIFK